MEVLFSCSEDHSKIQHGRPMERVWACPKQIFFSGWKAMQNLNICGKQEQMYFSLYYFLWINLMTGGFYTKESYKVRLYKLSWSEKLEQIKSFNLIVSFNPLRTKLFQFNEPSLPKCWHYCFKSNQLVPRDSPKNHIPYQCSATHVCLEILFGILLNISE